MMILNYVGRAITGLFTLGLASILTAEMLQFANVPDWGNYASIGAVLIFIALAVLLGAVFEIAILPALDISSALTALLMFYVYMPAALVMVGLFALFVVITFLAYLGE